MKSYIFVSVVLTTALTGYATGSADGEICSASSSNSFQLIEGKFSCGDEEEIKKTIYEAVKNMDPNIKLDIHIETKIFKGPESTPGVTEPTTANTKAPANVQTTSPNETLTPTVQVERTTAEAATTEDSATTVIQTTELGASTASTSTPEMTTAATTEGSATTVIETTKLEKPILTTTTPEMTTLVTTEKTTADIQTTQMVTTKMVRHSGPVYGSCSSNHPEPYFWVRVYNIKNVTFAQGRQICLDCSSVPAVIPDIDTAKNIHTVTSPFTNAELWTGTTIDPEIGKLSPSYSYWGLGSNSTDASKTKVSVTPFSFDASMGNLSPTETINGIVCWRPKS